MSTLHVLSHSPFSDSRLNSCLRLVGEHDAILLCGDATYSLTPASAALQALEDRLGGLKLFALEEDMQARNIQAPAWTSQVDYAGFVDLTIRFDKVNSWL
jgi:tRNA 2-thiouridine synthesizing protein B